MIQSTEFSGNVIKLQSDSECQPLHIQVVDSSSGTEVIKGELLIQEQFGDLQIQGINKDKNLSFSLNTKGNFCFTKEDGANTMGLLIEDGQATFRNKEQLLILDRVNIAKLNKVLEITDDPLS